MSQTFHILVSIMSNYKTSIKTSMRNTFCRNFLQLVGNLSDQGTGTSPKQLFNKNAKTAENIHFINGLVPAVIFLQIRHQYVSSSYVLKKLYINHGKYFLQI